MGGARALIASLGASISLVAGAAVSLLVVSFVFAYDGLAGSGYDGASSLAQVVVVPNLPPTPSGRDGRSGGGGAVVIAAPARGPSVERLAARKPAADGQVQPRQAIGVVDDVGGSGTASTPTTSRPDPAAPSAGDGVRELGGAATATVQQTGEAAGSAAAPLGPPVSQAVQEVLNLLNGIIEGATGGLAGALDPSSR